MLRSPDRSFGGLSGIRVAADGAHFIAVSDKGWWFRGRIVYEERVERGGPVYASPVLADGKIFYVTRMGQTYVVPAQPKYELLATNDLRDRSTFNASPAVAGSHLLIRSDSHLYCVGK